MLPLIKSTGIEHHLIEEKKHDDKAANKEESSKDDPSHVVWITNDGFLSLGY